MTIAADGIAYYPWNHGETLTAAALNDAIALAAGGTSGDINVLNSGADKTGSTDSSAAFQAAINAASAGGKVIVPSGTYTLHSAITATMTAGVTLEGAGAISTHLNCTGGDGFDITLSGGAASFSAKGLTFARLASSGPVYANTALSVVASATWQGGVFSDLFFFASSGYGWATALSLTAPGNASLRDITITMPNGNNTSGGVGINIAGIPASSTYAIDNSLDNVSIQGGHIGLAVGSWAQGIYISNSRMIGNDYGINWQSGTGIPEWLSVSNAHFNSGTAGILANGVGWVCVENTLFLRWAVATVWTAIDCEGCNNISLNNNQVYGNGNGNETGVVINNSAGNEPNTVSANGFGNLTGYCVVLNGITGNTVITGNSSNGVLQMVADNSGTGTNSVTMNNVDTKLVFGVPSVNAANDAAAATAGVPVGGTYRNGSVLMVRVA